MMASSAVFVGVLYGVKGKVMNETALIGASCAGMAVRISYAFLHARKKAGVDVRTLFPKAVVTVVIVGCGTILRRIYRTGRWTQNWRLWGELIGFGGVLGVFTLAIM